MKFHIVMENLEDVNDTSRIDGKFGSVSKKMLSWNMNRSNLTGLILR